jgi:RNA polymerase sigma factor (sigma-70 family)
MSNNDKYNLKLLLMQALAGDARAWNDFFTEIRKYLHAQIRLLPVAEHSIPLDYSNLVQSALRRVLEKMGDRFPDGIEERTLGRFLGWAKAIVQNRGWDELRRRQRQQKEPAGSAVEWLADPRPRQQNAKRDRIAAAVAAALNRLEEKDRQVIELFWFEELSDVEISQRLGCSARAARVRRWRAIRKLRSAELQCLLEDSYDNQF